MPISVDQIVLLAKQREIEELNGLRNRVQLSGTIGHMIHVLQSERGASSIFLASKGRRFRENRAALINESETIEALFREHVQLTLDDPAFTDARIISLTGWALLGLDALPGLRDRINRFEIEGQASVAAFSRLIAGLIALVFELADAGIDAEISRLLLGLFNLVEGKELAGQERAMGALAFGSGHCDAALQQRISLLIEGQERSFRIFLEFADPTLGELWRQMENTPCITRLRQLRETIAQATVETRLDPEQSNLWFDCCSERITYMWKIQRQLVETLQQRCAERVLTAERELQDSEGLLASLREQSPARAEMTELFFAPDMPLMSQYDLHRANGDAEQSAPRSLIDLLQAQSSHLADVEAELSSVRRALDERKSIERAKGILMSRYQISEEQAYRQLRSTAMEQNRRLGEVARQVLDNSK